MARPIKETPVLSGKDADNFVWNLEHPTPASTEEKERARKIYDAVMSDPECDW